TSNLDTKFFNNQGIHVIEWHVQLPDLNSIEYLWDLLKMLVNSYENPSSRVFELWEKAAVK
ncbi:hypothetical protein BDZ94DRAFT_1159562, partial [Collybia nuda]